jgi:hypothetical protein
MSFGSSKKAKNAAAQGAAFAQPKNFNSPYGSTTVGQENFNYFPKANPNADQQLSNVDNKLTQMTSAFPTELNVDDFYNNPFYESTHQQLRRPIDYQYGVDRKNQMDEMNAQNLVGGSYSALQQDLLGRRYDQQYANAADQARTASSNAYQQSYANQIAGMSALRGDQAANMQNIYYPLQMANQATQAISPLQGAQANIYGGLSQQYASKKSPLQSILDFAGQGAQAIGSAGGSEAFFSDRRLKQNIERVGTHPNGLPVYIYDYVWGEKGVGCMADEVEQVCPEAVSQDENGYAMVDYARLAA